MPAAASKYAWPKEGTVCRRLVDLMLDGKAHDYAEMGDALYGDDEEGGPLNMRGVLRMMIKRLRDTGWPVVKLRNKTYCFDLAKPLPKDEGRPAVRYKTRRGRRPADSDGHDWGFNETARVAWPDHPLDGYLVLVKRGAQAYRSYLPDFPQGASLDGVVVARPIGALIGGADFLLPASRLERVKAASTGETPALHVSRETSAGGAA